jgi:hypothetical protein
MAHLWGTVSPAWSWPSFWSSPAATTWTGLRHLPHSLGGSLRTAIALGVVIALGAYLIGSG